MRKLMTLLVVGACGFGCGKKSDSDAEQGSLYFGIRPTGKASASLALDSAATDFRNTSIASGAPSSLTIYISKMTLKSGAGEKLIFSETAGKPIYVGAKSVDISSLFTNYACVDQSTGTPVKEITECPCGLDSDKKAIAKNSDGKCPDSGTGGVANVQVETGTFDTLDVEFQVRAKAKGCVTGNFSSVASNGTATQGSRTYCTKASAHTFQSTPGVAAASELEMASTAAEEMDYQISKANELYTDATKTFLVSYPIKDSVKVEKDSTTPPRLTMMLDTNRMLRFYNNNITQSPNPGMSSTRSYFFSTVFEESSFVFVGLPGDIRGFQWWTDACSGDGTNVPTCSSSTTVVAGWLTVVKDSAGKPLLAGLMPDDDNSLTIIKGSNKSSAGIDQSYFTATGTNYDIKYALSQSTGTVKAVNLDATTDTTQSTTFVGMQKYGGKIYLKRKL